MMTGNTILNPLENLCTNMKTGPARYGVLNKHRLLTFNKFSPSTNTMSLRVHKLEAQWYMDVHCKHTL